MKKKTTSLGMKLVAFLAMLMLFCIPVSAGVKETAGEYEIYPTPQEITYGDKEMQLTDQVKLSIGSDIDDYTKTRITQDRADRWCLWFRGCSRYLRKSKRSGSGDL